MSQSACKTQGAVKKRKVDQTVCKTQSAIKKRKADQTVCKTQGVGKKHKPNHDAGLKLEALNLAKTLLRKERLSKAENQQVLFEVSGVLSPTLARLKSWFQDRGVELASGLELTSEEKRSLAAAIISTVQIDDIDMCLSWGLDSKTCPKFYDHLVQMCLKSNLSKAEALLQNYGDRPPTSVVWAAQMSDAAFQLVTKHVNLSKCQHPPLAKFLCAGDWDKFLVLARNVSVHSLREAVWESNTWELLLLENFPVLEELLTLGVKLADVFCYPRPCACKLFHKKHVPCSRGSRDRGAPSDSFDAKDVDWGLVAANPSLVSAWDIFLMPECFIRCLEQNNPSTRKLLLDILKRNISSNPAYLLLLEPKLVRRFAKECNVDALVAAVGDFLDEPTIFQVVTALAKPERVHPNPHNLELATIKKLHAWGVRWQEVSAALCVKKLKFLRDTGAKVYMDACNSMTVAKADLLLEWGVKPLRNDLASAIQEQNLALTYYYLACAKLKSLVTYSFADET